MVRLAVRVARLHDGELRVDLDHADPAVLPPVGRLPHLPHPGGLLLTSRVSSRCGGGEAVDLLLGHVGVLLSLGGGGAAPVAAARRRVAGGLPALVRLADWLRWQVVGEAGAGVPAAVAGWVDHGGSSAQSGCVVCPPAMAAGASGWLHTGQLSSPSGEINFGFFGGGVSSPVRTSPPRRPI